MRYYQIIISDPTTGYVLVPDPVTRQFVRTPPSATAVTYASHINGTFFPGALDIEFDFPVYPLAIPQGGSALKVKGVSLAEIAQRADLNGMNIVVSGGMQAGLPLAKPQQSGVLIEGQIFQAFGNWQGTEQSLDFVILPGYGSPKSPVNCVLDWKANQPLGPALQQTLQTAFPGYTVDVNISPNVVFGGDQPAVHPSVTQLAQFIKGLTSKLNVQASYEGVDIAIRQKKILVYDGTVAQTPRFIFFEDMIGQPTWIEPQVINISFVMRADLWPGSAFNLPSELISPFVLTAPSAAVPNTAATAKNSSAFQGNFVVRDVHHFGHYRQPDGNSWTTVINAFPQVA